MTTLTTISSTTRTRQKSNRIVVSDVRNGGYAKLNAIKRQVSLEAVEMSRELKSTSVGYAKLSAVKRQVSLEAADMPRELICDKRRIC